MNKVKEYQVETIVDTLCSNMLSDKQQLRDISSIGMSSCVLIIIEMLIPKSCVLKYNYCVFNFCNLQLSTYNSS